MSYQVPIEMGKIREFARATQSSNSAYAGAGAIIPPTFLTTARMTWEPVDQNPTTALDLDWSKVLHAEEEYVFHGPPPHAGQVLTVEAFLDSEWEREGKRGGKLRFICLVNRYSDEAGVLVAEQRMTVVQTGQPPAVGGPRA